MYIDNNLKYLISKTKIFIHPDDFVIISIDRNEESKIKHLFLEYGIEIFEPFSSITFNHSEVSIVFKTDKWSMLKNNFYNFQEEGPYRLITFDIVLDLSVIGFLAVVSDMLAKAGISIYALSTYLRDHILIKKKDSDKALIVLKNIIEDYSKN